jgi:hypothetical protein
MIIAIFLLIHRGPRSILGSVKWKPDENRRCPWRPSYNRSWELLYAPGGIESIHCSSSTHFSDSIKIIDI